MASPNWRAAMASEFNALLQQGTWDLVPKHEASNIIGCKWLFRVKRHPDGSIDRFKARLVAKGFHQRPGLDYDQTFSPVIKPSTVRLVLTFIQQQWHIRQFVHSPMSTTSKLTQNDDTEAANFTDYRSIIGAL
jgi:hypothetical protein